MNNLYNEAFDKINGVKENIREFQNEHEKDIRKI